VYLRKKRRNGQVQSNIPHRGREFRPIGLAGAPSSARREPRVRERNPKRRNKLPLRQKGKQESKDEIELLFDTDRPQCPINPNALDVRLGGNCK
jgi:hypothetical protein